METRRPRRSPARPLRALVACLALAVLANAGAQTVSLKSRGKQVQIAVGEAAVLPADFPKDVAVPAAATLVRVQRAGASTTLVFTAPGEPDPTLADLEARMRADGWQQAAVKAPASGRAQAWEKDQRAVVAWIASDETPAADNVGVAAATPTAAAGADADARDTATPRVRIQLRLIARRGDSPTR